MPADRLHIGEFDGNPFWIPASTLHTGRTAVLGMSGSGKSHLIGVLCEEMCKLDLPIIIVDPEGEYSTLKEKYEIVWACNEKDADIMLNIESAKKLAEGIVAQGGRLILDISESSNEFQILSIFLNTLYLKESELRSPILVIVEEADRFVPQSRGDQIRELHEISRRGRKRGIGVMLATQRPAMVDKNVLSQCGNQFIGKLRTQNDLEAVSIFFPYKRLLDRLPEMERGEFYVMGEISPSPHLIKVRPRETTHKGSTPTLTRKGKFTVDGFLREMESEDTPETPADDEEPEEEEKGEEGAVKGEVKPEEGHEISAGETKEEKKEAAGDVVPPVKDAGIPGIPFSLSEGRAMEIAVSTCDPLMKLESIFSPGSSEVIDQFESVYWPMMVCRIESAVRGFFGLNISSIYSIWDCVFLSCIKMEKNYEMHECAEFDPKISPLNWKEIRLLIELSSQDLTVHDLALRTGFSVEEVKKIVSGMNKKHVITPVSRVGKAWVYRPLAGIKRFDLSGIRSPLPETSIIHPSPAQRKVSLQVGEEFIRNIVKGVSEDTDISECRLFYFPFYLVSLTHRKKGTRRVVRINGVTGSWMELHGWREKVAMQ
jgi:hypothetical protein